MTVAVGVVPPGGVGEYDALVTDFVMPEMYGLELIAAARNLQLPDRFCARRRWWMMTG